MEAFGKQCSAIAISTALGQLFYFVFIFCVARACSENDFGLFGQLVSLLMLLQPLGNFHLSHALLVADSTEKLRDLFQLCVCIIATITTLILLCLLITNQGAGIWGEISTDIATGLIFCTAFALISLCDVATTLLTKLNKINTLAAGRIIRNLAFIFAASALFLGFSSLPFLAACIGFGYFCEFLALMRKNWHTVIRFSGKNLRRPGRLFREFSDFPKFALPGSLVTSISNNGMPILLGLAFSNPLSGLYFFLEKVLNVPITFVSKSMSVVFTAKLSSTEYLSSKVKTTHLVTVITAVLTGLGLVVAFMYFLVVPHLVNIGLGNNYDRVFGLLVFLVPRSLAQFIALPLSQIYIIKRRQRLLFCIQLVGHGLIFTAVGITVFCGGSGYTVIGVFGIMGAVFYTFQLAMSLKISDTNLENILKLICFR